MKKEYETPKMEIVEMATLGNLLDASDFPGSVPVVPCDELPGGCEDD